MPGFMAPDVTVNASEPGPERAHVARGSVSVHRLTRRFSIGGASGCGKSTLLRMIAGLDKPDVGSVTHDGAKVSRPSLKRGLVFQDPRLFPWLTVQENVAVALLNSGFSADAPAASVREHIALVGLAGFAL